MRVLLDSLFISSFSVFLRARVCRANFNLPLPISTRVAHGMESATVAEKDKIDNVDAEKAKEEDSGNKLAQEMEKKLAEEIESPPEKPLPDDCCGSGCETCVWDIYYDQLQEYNSQRDAFIKSLSSSNPKN